MKKKTPKLICFRCKTIAKGKKVLKNRWCPKCEAPTMILRSDFYHKKPSWNQISKKNYNDALTHAISGGAVELGKRP
jgi:hypothetical protein